MAAVELPLSLSTSQMSHADSVQSHDDLVQQLVASTAATYSIHNLRDRFLDKALETRGSQEVPIGEPGWELSGRTDAGNPCTMGDEIKGQKDYFRKLKFKYQEQESKLIFLGAITSEEPQTALQGQIDEAEKANAEKKSQLKATKLQAQQIRDEAVELGREVEAAHSELQKDAQEASVLSKQIKEMELELTRLRAMYPPTDRLTTSAANDILDSQIAEMQMLDDEVKRVNLSIDAIRDEVSRTAKEVGRLSRERDREEARAREAKAGREKVDGEGKALDGKVDELCRWYTSAIDLYKQLLGIESISAVSATELHLAYRIPDKPTTTLALMFDAFTKRLINAHLLSAEGSHAPPALDIQESVEIAVAQNDVPGLVGEVLARLQ